MATFCLLSCPSVYQLILCYSYMRFSVCNSSCSVTVFFFLLTIKKSPSSFATDSFMCAHKLLQSFKSNSHFFSLEMRVKITNDVLCFNNQLFISSNFEAQPLGMPFGCLSLMKIIMYAAIKINGKQMNSYSKRIDC